VEQVVQEVAAMVETLILLDTQVRQTQVVALAEQMVERYTHAK
jgi:hypothetical protein